MHFELDNTYHVYNRGNNKGRIFFNPWNYSFFIKKVAAEWSPYCDILCYTLMHNHFHFILQPAERGSTRIIIQDHASHLQVLSKVIGKTLSSYANAINNQNKTTGSLFTKKTRAKCLTNEAICKDDLTISDYLLNCFHYVHNNPLAARLVKDASQWQWTSWHEYFGDVKDGLCNLELAHKIFGPEIFQRDDERPLDSRAIIGIW